MRVDTIAGVELKQIPVHADSRGYLQELWRGSDWKNQLVSFSHEGVLRGMHFQICRPQAKLVTVLTGIIFDVAVDLREDSRTYQKWYGVTIEGGSGKALMVPAGLAHGFYVVKGPAVVVYWCSEPYDAASQSGIRWDDPTVAIGWPTCGKTPLLSDKDKALPYL